MESLKAYLDEHRFLKGLRPEHIDLLVDCASNVRFAAGEFIFREGKEAENFFFIRHGKVALEIYSPGQGPINVQTVGEGDVLGWSWLIPPYNWNFDARVLELTRAIQLDARCFRTKCEQDHTLGYEILKRFSHLFMQRLNATRLQLLDLYKAN